VRPSALHVMPFGSRAPGMAISTHGGAAGTPAEECAAEREMGCAACQWCVLWMRMISA
jgi:hypothetical protein